MHKVLNIIAIGLFLLTSGCENHDSNSEALMIGEMTMDHETQYAIAPPSAIQIERKLIKNGDVSFQTENLTQARKNIFKALDKFKGYVASDSEYKTVHEITNTLLIRVPSEKFDELLNEITIGIKRFDRKEIIITDVTAEFLDIEARLKTKKELESRYLDILKKANTVSEILEVEKQIGELRSDIESIEGRLKLMSNQVALSTLQIRVYESIPTTTEFGYQFKDGFKNGWENLILFFVFLVNLWPFILIIIFLIIGIRIWRKRRKKLN